ncbi:uncharacterized protein RBU33_020331 [Hipposideros larvatus]
MFMARARVGLGREGPGYWGPSLTPPPPPRLQRAPGEGSLGQRLCFPDSSYVCGSAACAQRAGGAGGSLPQHPLKMTTDTEAEGREGAAGQWGWKPRDAHTRCLGAARRPPPRAAGARAGAGLRGRRRGRSPAGEARGRRGGGCRGGAHHLRRVAGSSGAAAGGRGAAEGCGPGGATGSGEPSAPTGATFSSSRRASAARTGWTRFRAERRGPAARCSAPPPAADASAAAPPGLPPALAAPGDLGTEPCVGSALRRGKRTARNTKKLALRRPQNTQESYSHRLQAPGTTSPLLSHRKLTDLALNPGSRRAHELLGPAGCSSGVGWGGQAAPRCSGRRSSQAGQRGKEPARPRFTHLQSGEAIGTCCSPRPGPGRRRRESWRRGKGT